MRRSTGAFVRRSRNELLVVLAAGAGAVMGLSAGAVFHPLIGAWVGGMWALGAVLVVAVVLLLCIRSLERVRLGNLVKGEKAETHASHAIEYALTPANCAVAHSVTTIARVGDIDHLVATPVSPLGHRDQVPAGPAGTIPPRCCAKSRTTRTRCGSGRQRGTPVRGCLVLAKDARPHQKTVDYGKEPIVVHTPASLARELKAEARQERVIDEQVAANVWELGRVAQ